MPSYVLVKDNELVKDGSPDGRIAFDVDGTTLTVRDVIEGEKMRLGVDREPDLSPALPALFPSPVDDAVSFEAQSLTVPEYTSIVVRDDEGKFIGRPNEPTEFPRGSYCIDITGVTKASLRFEDAELSVSGVEGSDPVEIALGRPATVSLGAQMTVGEKPAVRLDNGYTEQLPTDGRQLEERAEALLRIWFFLDTLVRTDGYTLSDREEYEQVGPQLPFYPPNLDELSLKERLMEYLEVDPATVEPHAPEWSTEAVLRPGPAGAELLPHLAHVLAPVRVRGSVERTRPGDSVGLTTADRPTDGPQSPTHDDDPISDPDPDSDPIPAWTAAAIPAAHEHELQRTSPDPGEANVTLLVRSAERARRLRETLTDPSLAAGVGSLSVLETPTADTVAEVLSDPSIDLLYCDLPLDGGAPVVDSGRVEFQHRAAADGRSAPAVSVFEGSRRVAVGADAVRRGGTGSAVIDGRIPDDRIRTLVELLASVGLPLDTSLATLRLSSRAPVRFAGGTSTNVVPPNPPLPRLLSAESVSESKHRFSWRTVLCPNSWVGSEYQIVHHCFDGKDRLVGRNPEDRPLVSSQRVVDSSDEPDTTLFLNGQFVSPTVDLTVEDVEKSARRALAADDSTADRPTERRGETECHD